MKEYKDKIDPLVKEGKQLLKCIKKKGQVVPDKPLKLVDNEERMAGPYDEQDDLVESRPALPNEPQAITF